MLETLSSLSPSSVYFLSALAMAARTFWWTRPRRCACCDVTTKPYVVTIEKQIYDLRYLLVMLLATFWPLAVFVMIASRLVSFFFSGAREE